MDDGRRGKKEDEEEAHHHALMMEPFGRDAEHGIEWLSRLFNEDNSHGDEQE